MRSVFKMRLTLLFCSLLFTAQLAQAETETVPDKVMAYLQKKHPTAQDFRAVTETHFGQQLLEVSFKEEDSEARVFRLFKPNGQIFGVEYPMPGLQSASPAVSETLAKQFPNYALQKTEQIPNPNGIGEEYEIYLKSGIESWKVILDHKGNIKQQQRL